MAPPPEAPASQYKSSDAQFEDLHNRLQMLSHSMDNFISDVSRLSSSSEGRHQELMRNLPSGDRLNAIDQRLTIIENLVRSFESHFSVIKNTVKDSHTKLADGLTSHVSDGTWPILSDRPRYFSVSSWKPLLTRCCSDYHQWSTHGSYCLHLRRHPSRTCGSLPIVQTENKARTEEVLVD